MQGVESVKYAVESVKYAVESVKYVVACVCSVWRVCSVSSMSQYATFINTYTHTHTEFHSGAMVNTQKRYEAKTKRT
jgi:hypothetical protein